MYLKKPYPHNEKKPPPPKKCLCRPKIDLFLVCFPIITSPKFRSNSLRATSGPFVPTSGKDKKMVNLQCKKDIYLYI